MGLYEIFEIIKCHPDRPVIVQPVFILFLLLVCLANVKFVTVFADCSQPVVMVRSDNANIINHPHTLQPS